VLDAQGATIPAVQHSLLSAAAPQGFHLSEVTFYPGLGCETKKAYADRKVADELE